MEEGHGFDDGVDVVRAPKIASIADHKALLGDPAMRSPFCLGSIGTMRLPSDQFWMMRMFWAVDAYPLQTFGHSLSDHDIYIRGTK